MTRLLGVCVLAAISAAPAFAEKKSCEQLAAQIASKLDTKGVTGYQLDIVAAGEVGGRQVVGSCQAGAKKITYTKDAGSKSSSTK